MRLEQINAKALEKYNYNRYLLAKAVGKRAKELLEGAKPLVDMNIKEHKPTDIAIVEIAEGKISIEMDKSH